MRKWLYKYFGTSCPKRKKVHLYCWLIKKVTRFTIQIYRFYKQFIQKQALITCGFFASTVSWATDLWKFSTELTSHHRMRPISCLKGLLCCCSRLGRVFEEPYRFFLCNIQTKLVFILVCLFAMCCEFQSSELWDGTKPAPINGDTKDLRFLLNQVSEHNMVIWAVTK